MGALLTLNQAIALVRIVTRNFDCKYRFREEKERRGT